MRVRPFDAWRRMGFWQKVNHFCNASPSVPLWLVRSVGSLGLAALALFHAEAIRAHAALTLAVLAWWGLLVVVGRAGLVWNSGQVDAEYRVLWLLPVSAERIFQYWLRRINLGSGWLCFECLLVYGILAVGSPQPVLTWAGAVLCAGAQAAFAVTLLLLLLALRIQTEWVMLLLFCLALAFPMVAGTPNEPLIANALSLANPLGWINVFYLEGCLQGNARAWWKGVPVLIVFASLPYSLRAVRRRHLAGAFRTAQKRRERFDATSRKSRTAPLPHQTGSMAQGSNTGWLQPHAWNRGGLIERLLSRLLKPHEQVMAQMLLPGAPRWSNRFLGLMVYASLYLAANTQIHYTSLEDLFLATLNARQGAAVTLVAGIASLVCFALILLKGMSLLGWFVWPEPALRSRPGVQPACSFQLFPVNYWETAKVIAKIHTLLLLLLWPLALILSFTPLCELLLRPAGRAHAFLPKMLGLVWGCILVLTSLRLTPSFQEGLKHWRLLLKKLLLLLGLYVLGVGLLVSDTLLLDAVLEAAVLLLSAGWFLYSGRQYRLSH